MSTSSRRWFRLSLKSLFLLVLLVATFFAGYSLATKQAERERRQAELKAQQQAEEARRQGGLTDYLVTSSGGMRYTVGEFDSDGPIDFQLYRNPGSGKSQDATRTTGR